jgi:hypothetical protein
MVDQRDITIGKKNPKIVHYKKSQVFKRFNLIKVSTLTKMMFTFTKGMGHEKHMVLLVGSLD